MKLHIIFAQRSCAYEGQYAPEALEVITEYGNDDNPDFLVEKVKEAEDSKEFTSIKVIDVEVNDDEIDSRLFPVSTPVPGTII